MKDTHILFLAAGMLCIFIAVLMMFQMHQENERFYQQQYQQQQQEFYQSHDNSRRIRVWPFIDIETQGSPMYRKGYHDGYFGHDARHCHNSEYNKGYRRGRGAAMRQGHYYR